MIWYGTGPRDGMGWDRMGLDELDWTFRSDDYVCIGICCFLVLCMERESLNFVFNIKRLKGLEKLSQKI